MRVVLLLAVLAAACSTGETPAPDPGSDPGDVGLVDVAPDVPSDDGRDVAADDAAGADPGHDAEAPDAHDAVDVPDVLPGDLAKDEAAPDLPPPPPSCCRTGDDCGVDAPACVPPSKTSPSPYGVCVARPETGRCWSDLDCGIGQACEGAGLCPCQADCDLIYAGPGACVAVDSACTALSPSWVLEVCDARSIVVFDGTKCVATCPGCCGCEPFCDRTFETMEACTAACETAPADCSPWTVSLVEGPFDLLFDEAPPGACERALAKVAPCRTDADCLGTAPASRLGERCVFGSCVDCASTVDCPDGTLCEQGRCEAFDDGDCPQPPHTDAPIPGCGYVRLSGKPCAILYCDTPFDTVCNDDEYCLGFSDRPFQRCVNNRCTFCRTDADCVLDPEAVCMTPGICLRPDPDASALYGAWLLRSPGTKDAGYLRFEFDGAVRHAGFEDTADAVDTIPALPCADAPSSLAQRGSWESMTTGEGILGIRLTINLECAPRDGFRADWQVAFDPDDPRHATFKDLSTLAEYDVRKVPAAICEADFSRCLAPEAAAMSFSGSR